MHTHTHEHAHIHTRSQARSRKEYTIQTMSMCRHALTTNTPHPHTQTRTLIDHPPWHYRRAIPPPLHPLHTCTHTLSPTRAHTHKHAFTTKGTRLVSSGSSLTGSVDPPSPSPILHIHTRKPTQTHNLHDIVCFAILYVSVAVTIDQVHFCHRVYVDYIYINYHTHPPTHPTHIRGAGAPDAARTVAFCRRGRRVSSQ